MFTIAVTVVDLRILTTCITAITVQQKIAAVANAIGVKGQGHINLKSLTYSFTSRNINYFTGEV